VIAVGRRLELALASRFDAVLLHQLANPLLAHTDTRASNSFHTRGQPYSPLLWACTARM